MTWLVLVQPASRLEDEGLGAQAFPASWLFDDLLQPGAMWALPGSQALYRASGSRASISTVGRSYLTGTSCPSWKLGRARPHGVLLLKAWPPISHG
jgi:hypothetical protein